MIIPSTRLFTAGEVETGAYLNSAVTNLGNFMLGKPIATLRQTAAQSLAVSGTAYALTFDTEDIDRDNGHSTSTNTTRYTAQTAGWYYVFGQVSITGNVTGSRTASLRVNSAALNTTQVISAYTLNSNTWTAPTSGMIYLNVGDYVELWASQTSGGALNTFVTAPYQPFMSVIWVSS